MSADIQDLLRISRECIQHAERSRRAGYEFCRKLARSYAVLHVRYREQARALAKQAKEARP